jgi:hypothetical protein
MSYTLDFNASDTVTIPKELLKLGTVCDYTQWLEYKSTDPPGINLTCLTRGQSIGMTVRRIFVAQINCSIYIPSQGYICCRAYFSAGHNIFVPSHSCEYILLQYIICSVWGLLLN